MKIFNTEADLAAASLGEGQLVRTKGYTSADDGQSTLWRIATTGQGVGLANGNVAVPYVNDVSGRKNLFINGDMSTWQRGTSFSPTGGVLATYTADRWAVGSDRTVDRVQDAPAGSQFTYAIECSFAAPAGNLGLVQAIELPTLGVAGVFQVGKTFTISGKIKGTSGRQLRLAIAFVNGARVSTDKVVVLPETLIHACDGTWQDFAYSFEVGVSPNANNIAMQIEFASENDSVATTFSFTGVQLEEGQKATEFEHRPVAEELALCQRYYEASTSMSDILAGVNHKSFSLLRVTSSSTASNDSMGPSYAVTKRVNPTLTIYSRNGSAGFVSAFNNNNNLVAVNTVSSPVSGVGALTFAANVDVDVAYNWTADAEL